MNLLDNVVEGAAKVAAFAIMITAIVMCVITAVPVFLGYVTYCAVTVYFSTYFEAWSNDGFSGACKAVWESLKDWFKEVTNGGW